MELEEFKLPSKETTETFRPSLVQNISDGQVDYDADKILQADRQYYSRFPPPFVRRRSSNSRPLNVLLADEEGGVTSNMSQLHNEDWDKDSVYWIAVVQGRRFILKRLWGGSQGSYFRLWLGHEQHFRTKPFAYSSHKSPSDSLNTVASYIPNRAYKSHYDDWIRRLRHYYGVRLPEFVQNRGAFCDGQTRDIVLTVGTGIGVITAQAWSPDSIFWIYDNCGWVYIAIPLITDQRKAYWRWQGIGKRIWKTPIGTDAIEENVEITEVRRSMCYICCTAIIS